MFEIEYKGGNAFEIVGKNITLEFDPRRSINGLKDITVSGGVEIGTEKRFLTNSPDYKLSIGGPGEYETSDVTIKGVQIFRQIDNPSSDRPEGTFYSIDIEGVRIAVLGNIDNSLSEEQLDELGSVDILIIPVGGNGYSPDAETSANLTKTIEPKIVIPVSFADPGIRYEVPQDPLERFIQAVKAPVKEDVKLKIKNGILPDSLEVHELRLST